MLKRELLEILVCPKCKGELIYEQKQQELICNKCCLAYPIKDDIPIMLIDEAKKILLQAKDEKQKAEAIAMMRRAIIDSKLLKKRKTTKSL